MLRREGAHLLSVTIEGICTHRGDMYPNTTHSTWLSIRIDLSRSAYSETFNILLIELETSYVEKMFPKLSRISG